MRELDLKGVVRGMRKRKTLAAAAWPGTTRRICGMAKSAVLDTHCPQSVRGVRLGWLPDDMTCIIPRTAMMLALLALLPTCALGGTTPTPRPSPSATSVAGQQRCARLANRGFTPCPPTPDHMPLPPTTIRNATNGAISDLVAQQWGHAFQLTEAYYYWAIQHNARDALTSGALADPTPGTVANLFSGDLMQLDQAKQAGGQLIYTPPRVPATQSVSIPAELQEAMRRQGLIPREFGLAVRFIGPSRRAIRMSDGTETVLTQRDASYTIAVVIWGELRNDPDLGLVWYEYGNYSCDGAVRNVCQL